MLLLIGLNIIIILPMLRFSQSVIFIGFFLSCLSEYIPNKQVKIPAETFRLLYTTSQKYLMVASQSEVLLFYGINGSKIDSFNLDGNNDASSIAVSNDNTHFAIGFNSGSVYVYQQGQFTGSKLELEQSSVITSMCFTNDNQYLVIGLQSDTIEVYSFAEQKSITQNFQNQRVFTVACSPVQQNRFVAGGGQNTLSKFVLYDFSFSSSEITEIYDFPHHENATALDAVFSSDGSTIYRVGENGNIWVYEGSQNSTQFTEKSINVGSQGILYQISVSVDGNILGTVNDTNAILVYPNQNNLEVVIDADIKTTSKTVSLAPKAENLVVIGTDGTADIFGQCPEKQYIDQNGECQGCNNQCVICQQSPDNCFECIVSYYLTGQGCKYCGDGCLQCQQDNDCLNCDQQKHFERQSDGNCGCQDTFYADSGQCKQCSQAIVGCISCDNAQKCTKCDDNIHRELVNSKCLCKTGWYEDQSKQCQQCSIENCLQCSGVSNCTKCVDTFYIDAGSCKLCSDSLIGCINCDNEQVCTKCDPNKKRVLSQGHCICQDRYYDDQGVCTLCEIDHCLKCSNVSTCIQCDASEYWIVNKTTNQCSCFPHYVQIDDTCLDCPVGCLICDKNETCEKCDVDEHFQEEPIQGLCQCSSGYYLNDENQTCDPCSLGCKNCTDADSCQQCNQAEHFVMVEGEDRCQCQSSYFLKDDKCNICNQYIKACKKCESEAKCDECQGNTKLSEDSKSCSCPSKQYITDKYQCQSCGQECAECTDKERCMKCEQGYDLNEDKKCITTGLSVLITIIVIVGVVFLLVGIFVILKCVKRRSIEDYQEL